ncbi:glycoside hydrolase family 16 protein [Mycena pura]|uniref:Glycoside hydrolase family 16 protein n=1 Tax=Mycena pura TaxID=153505 RepID=A0AAD7E2H3_9AGAR|nr:glycoside hydrolase family 16 protein [Mycena pura]
MPALSALVLFAWSLVALGAPQHTRHNARQARRLSARTTYTLKDHYNGTDFFRKWNFFSGSDPTHGNVNFLTKDEATAKGLAYAQDDGTFVLAVDDKTTLNKGANRDSVRISSPDSYNEGLFIADVYAMPHGPTVWPAYWSVGPNWPNKGEIDIIEGVGDSTTNQMTLHTSAGCTLDTNHADEFTGKVSTTNCESANGNNDGCGITDFSPQAYGHDFNTIAGGVTAHTVSAAGIKIWSFARTAIPADITAGKPDPDSWGKPAAFWSSDTCNIGDHFQEQVLTFDTTLCGDWAGSAFKGGPAACTAAVADPSNYSLAKWMINYVSVYES